MQDDDIVIHGDVDEIFPAEDIHRMVKAAQEYGWVNFIGDKFYYKINLWCNEPWFSGFAATGAYLRDKTLNQLRNNAHLSTKIHTNAKHFSYLGTPDVISQKIKSFAHSLK